MSQMLVDHADMCTGMVYLCRTTVLGLRTLPSTAKTSFDNQNMGRQVGHQFLPENTGRPSYTYERMSGGSGTTVVNGESKICAGDEQKFDEGHCLCTDKCIEWVDTGHHSVDSIDHGTKVEAMVIMCRGPECPIPFVDCGMGCTSTESYFEIEHGTQSKNALAKWAGECCTEGLRY